MKNGEFYPKGFGGAVLGEQRPKPYRRGIPGSPHFSETGPRSATVGAVDDVSRLTICFMN
jgi:hypothetical protein